MADFVMIKQMMELADKGGTLPENWYEEYIKALRAPWVNAVDSGRKRKEYLDLFDSEAYGYPCPICGSTPDKFEKTIKFGNHIIGVHDSYRLDCDCEENLTNNIREEIGIKERMIHADIPYAYSQLNWNTWDQTVDKGLNESFWKIQGMSYGAGLNKILGNGLVLFGDVGRGKTLSGICLMKSIIEKTKLKCKYIPMADFTSRIMKSGKEGNYIDKIEKNDVLFLDDMDKLSTSSEWVQERVFSLFDNIFRSNKTLILSTNLKTIPDMESYFGTHGEAIISRMVEKMEFFRFTGGDDYRKKRRMENISKN